MLGFGRKKLEMPRPEEALPGRDRPIETAATHHVNGNPLKGPYPAGSEIAYFALGCYWGAERLFWTVPGVHVTAVGNMGGATPNPTYEELCSGRTGHTETVMVVYDPHRVAYEELIRIFFESHDPTQGMRQGNDVGTQYRSAIFFTSEAQREIAEAARQRYGKALAAQGYPAVSTEVAAAGPFYFAEAYHQQYLARNPRGYCGLQGTGVSCSLAG